MRDVREVAAGQAERDSGGAGPDRRRSVKKAGAAARDGQRVLRRAKCHLVRLFLCRVPGPGL